MQECGSSLQRRAAEGDRRALEQLLEHHGPLVRQRLHGRIPRRWQAVLSLDDVMQQTYTDAFVDIARFVPNGESSFIGWLMSLAKCNLLDALKMLQTERRGKRFRRVDLHTAEDSSLLLCEMIGVTRSTPSRRAARVEACGVLKEALQELPDSYRRVVQMYDLDNRPVEEVSETLHRSPGAVYMVRARAHRRLREILGHRSRYLSA